MSVFYYLMYKRSYFHTLFTSISINLNAIIKVKGVIYATY